MFETCLVGGPLHGRTKKFSADPQPVLVIPEGDGWFCRYRRASDQPGDGKLVYLFHERFEGQR